MPLPEREGRNLREQQLLVLMLDEDAQRQREIWKEADFRALWERRGLKPEEVEEKMKGQWRSIE